MITVTATVEETGPGGCKVGLEVQNGNSATVDEIKTAAFIQGAIVATLKHLDPAGLVPVKGKE